MEQNKKLAHVREIYMSKKENTFMYEEDLPSLPVPELHQTMEKYLKSVKPFVSREQFEETKKLAKNFENGVGKELQNKLKTRAAKYKNWLYDWWLKYAYLTFREPLAPCLNMSGPQSLNLTIWTPDESKALERMAMNLWATLDFYQNLREENLRPQTSKKGNHLSMHQFRFVFNTSRIPREGVDEIMCHFRTKSEGDSPRHLIVFCHGHVWLMNPWYSEGERLTIPELEEQIKYIKKISMALGEGPGIGALTFDHREMWAKNRKWLRALSKQNEENLELIESSILVYTLDESSPKDLNEACHLGLCGDPTNRWADKSYGGIAFENGYQSSCNDHTPFDAMANVVLGHYQHEIITEEFGGVWKGPKTIRKITMPRRLTFVLDELILDSIERIKILNRSLADNTVVLFKEFTIYGKNWIREEKLHPDSFVQCALQLAYFLMNKRFAPTYETATTRQFYKARTETIRSCTAEMVDFVKVMTSNVATVSERKMKLVKAVNRHLELTRECQNGEGIDRHLMGLKIIAAENGVPTPEIFNDPAFELSGGNGNFVLSTSTTGYTYATGGVSAMVKDGYGVFYAFLPVRDCITFYITAYRDGNSDAENYFQTVTRALIYMQEVVTDPQARL